MPRSPGDHNGAAGGGTGRPVRAFDRSAIPLGPAEDRPHGLTAADRAAPDSPREAAETSARARTILEGIADVFMAFDSRWRVTYANAAAERFYAVTRGDVLGKTFWDAFPAVVGTRVEREYRRAMAGRAAVKFEHLDEPFGRWSEIEAFPVDGGGLATFGRDVTERKRAEDRVRESDARFRAVADLVPDLLWRNDPAGACRWFNRRWTEYTGLSSEASEGFGWLDAVHPDDRERSSTSFLTAVETGRPLRHEQRIRGVDGRYRWFLTQAGPVLDDAGRVVQWFGAATDVHEHRLALDALRASREQLRDAVDEFEAGVEERTAELREALTSLSREQDVRKELLRRLVNVQEDERRRISRELHDQMGQHVASLMLGLRLAKDAAEDGSPLRDRLERLEVAADRIGREAHRIALELRPTALDDLGLVPALVNHLDDWALRTGVAAEVRTAGFDGERLPPPVETTIYRVVLEALTNVFKHADARRVIVTLNRFKDVASLIIEDDGKGFDVPRSAGAKGKLGVVGMRERAALVGGTLEVESTPDGGTSILVRIPVPTAADAP